MCLGLCTGSDVKPKLICTALFNTKYEIFVNNKKYCVWRFVLQMCINLHCRIDDIQDNCSVRRGIPAAHTVYGVARAISVAMCVIFTPLQRMLSTNQPDLIKLYTKMMLESWRGQALEIYWRDSHTCPSVEEYLEMVKRSKYRVRAMSRF
jgi:geranylgeranyl diphosphate synthase type 3